MKKTLYLSILLFCLNVVVLQAQTDRNYPDTLHQIKRLKQVDVNAGRTKKIKQDSLSGTLKLQQPILQIPQNIISVSSQLIQQQGGLELKDVARNASGIYFGYNSTPFNNSAAIKIRGFEGYTTTNGMVRNGSYGAVLDDQSLFESIEFVKGPAGFLNSVGEASGTININTKTPNKKLMNAELSGGSFGFGRISFDLGSDKKNKGFSYRFNTAYQHRNTYLDQLKTDKYVIAPVLQYNFSPNTFILAEYNYIRAESRNGSDITKIRAAEEVLKDNIHANYSAVKGMPLTYYQNQSGRLVAVHQFNKNWKLTSQSQYVSAPLSSWTTLSSETYTGVEFIDPTGITNRLSYNTQAAGRTFSTQLFLNGNFNTGSIKHLLLVGGDLTGSTDSLVNRFGVGRFPFYKDQLNYEVPGDEIGVLNPKTKSRFDNKTHYESIYLYDNINLTRQFLLSLGARYTWFKNKAVQKVSVSKPAKVIDNHQNAWSPRAALTFLADSVTSVFFLYDQSFVPQKGLRAGKELNTVTGQPEGTPVDPQRNNDFELGIKRQWFNGRLLTTVNGFYMVKRNVLVQDPVYQSLGFKRQIGAYTSKGYEFDVLGNITSRLSVSLNYTLVNAKITKDTEQSSLVGFKLPGTPQQIVNTWVQYLVPVSRYNNLAFSLGQVTNIKRATYSKDVYLNDFTKIDAGITYSAPRYYIRLVGDNLMNKRYIASGDIGDGYPIPDTQNFYIIEGDPINFRLSFGVKF